MNNEMSKWKRIQFHALLFEGGSKLKDKQKYAKVRTLKKNKRDGSE